MVIGLGNGTRYIEAIYREFCSNTHKMYWKVARDVVQDSCLQTLVPAAEYVLPGSQPVLPAVPDVS